ncbi:MAG: peptide deformylase [Acidobacteriota bacterium]|nr:peptide deformylase [Acidobacteriota bacterium]
MSILKVSRLGHPVLRQRTALIQPDEISTASMQRLINDMFDTMNEYAGIGLAAPQVHQELRLFVAGVDDPDSTMQPVVMINPEIEVIDEEEEEDWEGCLSIPDIRGKVLRAKNIRVHSLDRNGKLQKLTATGFPARVIQHETDHLNGILFVDRMASFESLTFLEEYGRYWDSGSGPDG